MILSAGARAYRPYMRIPKYKMYLCIYLLGILLYELLTFIIIIIFFFYKHVVRSSGILYR